LSDSFSFTRRYIFALSIIAILSTLAYFNLDHLISSQYESGKLINISEKQRMLSQQISLYAIYYKIRSLKKNVKEMEENHRKLLSYPMPEDLRKIYYDKPVLLDKKVRRYLYHAKKFLENRNGKSLSYVLKNSKPLLEALDQASKIYRRESEASTQKLKNVEFYIFLLTIITLIFEALFIFRPANKRIITKTNELTVEKDYSNTVIESNTNAIITLDKELKIKTYNKMAEKIFGYKRDEMLGKANLNKIVPKCKIFQEDDLFHSLRVLESGNMEEAREIEGMDKDGHIFPVRISFGTSGTNENIMIVVNIQDISKEKLKDRMLQEQSKFAALGEMIAIIAHQWRQPLAQLSFNCMYLQKKIKDPEIVQEIKKNEDILEFMSETITNFEDFYRKTDNTLFNPIVSINQALKIVDSLIKLQEIELIKNINSKLSIYGNSNTLAHVILSILQNTIDVIKNRNIKKPFIIISLKDTKDHIIITVKDNAGGINADPVEDIFKPFTSKKKTPSTGIGLYMSKLVIENKFHGSIKAQNIENGALFTIHLPH